MSISIAKIIFLYKNLYFCIIGITLMFIILFNLQFLVFDKVVLLYYIMGGFLTYGVDKNMFSKTDNTEQSILKDILSGTYQRGSKIPSQHKLMRKYNVSRTTLLRALNKLTSDGYLYGRQGSGTYVADFPENGKAPLQLTVVGMRGDDYPFARIFSGIGPVNWCTEKDAPEYLDKLSRQGNAVIWLLPHPSSMLMMEFLRHKNIPQLLINRNYSDYDCIISDSKSAMSQGMRQLLQERRESPALIAHRPGDLRPYLSDYLISFYEVCSEMGIRVDSELNFCRQYSPLRIEFRQIGRKLFGRKDSVRDIVVLNFELVLPILMSASEYGLECGKDFHLLSFDMSSNWNGLDGIIAMCHDYSSYRNSVTQWLELISCREKEPFHVKVPQKMFLPPLPGDLNLLL